MAVTENKEKVYENQGADFDERMEDVILIRGENGEMKRVEVADDVEND